MNLFFVGRSYEVPAETAIPGYWCDSGLERAVFWLFKEAEKIGSVSDVVLKPRQVPLGPANHRYAVDIRFDDLIGARGLCYVEAKGVTHASWHRNLKDWKHYGPGPLLIWVGTPSRVTLKDIVFPQGGGTHGSN